MSPPRRVHAKGPRHLLDSPSSNRRLIRLDRSAWTPKGLFHRGHGQKASHQSVELLPFNGGRCKLDLDLYFFVAEGMDTQMPDTT